VKQIGIALAFLLAGIGCAGAADRIDIASETPTSLAQYLHGGAPAVTVTGDLYLPKGTGPFPAMILKHGSGGLDGPTGDNIRKWAAAMNDWGIAAFVVDSFGPRGLKSTAKDQSALSFWADVADSFSALKVLAADPRIDKARIGIMGWSRGGTISLDTALETARQALIKDDTKFAVHVALYASETSQYRDSATDRAPMLVIHGAADNYVPAAPTEEYADWLKGMGSAVTFVAYPKTFHDFDVAGEMNGFLKALEVGAKCDMVVDVPTQKIVRLDHKAVDNPPLDQVKAYFKGCITHGATIEYNGQARSEAVDQVRAFLKDALHLSG
jgi:dienelactone hydrolase